MMMPDPWTLLSASSIELLGWVLLHFVWQGALLSAVLAGALYLLRGHPPSVRYVVSCVALVGLLALPVGTGLVLSEAVLGSGPAPETSVTTTEGTAGSVTVPSAVLVETSPSASTSWQARVTAWLRPALPWIVLGWAVGVLLFSVRLAGGAWRVRRLRRESVPAPDKWRNRLEALADRIGLRTDVNLRISDHADGPMVAGWWRPVVLVPAGFLTGLPPEQVEALLLHELAHVRRHDVLVGRLQAVVETLLFFHPATWWVSRQVRQTREACCDDLTVRAGADRAVYARALAVLAERTLTAPQSTGSLAASDGSLLARIRRLLDPSATPSRGARRLSMAVALLLLVALPLGVAACASQQSATEAEAAGNAPPDERAETPPTPPRAPEAEPEGPTVVVVQDDSVRRVVTIRRAEAVEVDSLDDGGYVLRYEGERIDTLDVPGPKVLVEPDSVKEEVRLSLDSDGLERHVRGLQLHSDSLQWLIETRFDADSLKRVLRKQFDLDSLEHRALELRWNSDSLEHVFTPDSLRGVFRERFDPDSLRRYAFRVRRRADSLARTFEEHFSEEDFAHEFAQSFSDSTFVLNPDAFHREDFELEGELDSLFFRRKRRADSLRRHFEQRRERWAEERPERLREQARRLRERAERLEERAEEMRVRSAPPDSSG